MILASSQRKLRGYIKFFKFDVTIKKNSNPSKIWTSRPILIKCNIIHYSVLSPLDTKFQLGESKFAWVRNFEKFLKKFKIKKNLNAWIDFSWIQYHLYRYNIFVCSFRMIARIFRELELPRPFFKKCKIQWNHKSGINRHENSRDEKVVTASLVS